MKSLSSLFSDLRDRMRPHPHEADRVDSSSPGDAAFVKHLDLWRTIKGDLTIHVLDRDEIARKNTERIESAVMAALSAYRAGQRPLPTVHFGTNAFDNDARALFEIPEMRQWCLTLYQRVPYILSILDAPTLSWYLPCVADIDVVPRGPGTVAWSISNESIKKMNLEIANAHHRVFDEMASTKEELDKLIGDSYGRIRSIFK